MSTTYREIMTQYEALRKTDALFQESRGWIAQVLRSFEKIIYIGSGSGYSLCKSAAMITAMRGGSAYTIPAGDLLVNADRYADMIRGALLVAFSRSGETSEIVRSVALAKERYACKCFAGVCAPHTSLEKVADWCLSMPWAYDESVCQTRTATNFYFSMLWFDAIAGGNEKRIRDLKAWIQEGPAFLKEQEAFLKTLGESDFKDAIILADGEACGVADEGSLAFCEICQVPAKQYHLLDVRHGPTVMITEDTLLVMLCNIPFHPLIEKLYIDLRKRTQRILVVGEPYPAADRTIRLPAGYQPEVYGIPLLNVCQLVSYYKAVSCGMNPDRPAGLDPWIVL